MKSIIHSSSHNSSGMERAAKLIRESDTVIIGAGAGLSTSAGFIYSGERFDRYFCDYIKKYHFYNMYEGGFYPFETMGEHWAYWSRYIYINRYMDAPKPVYNRLFELVKDKDYFVLTTNVDHCFQKAGFDKERLFYTQGDFGLFQCSKPCHDKTYDNYGTVRRMVLSQGFEIKDDGTLDVTNHDGISMTVFDELIPICPVCGRPMSMNLRADGTFVQDEGWYMASKRYEDFLCGHENTKTVFLELGVGMNTPGIVKYNFWNMVHKWEDAAYVCVNLNETFAPDGIWDKSVCIDGDIGSVIEELNKI